MTRPDPSPESARLAAGLRELKERTGLSLAGLAAKTTFSKSSWERYLNGRTLPPRPAVQELCRLAGEPAGRYLALRDLAQSEWSDDPPKDPTRTTTSTSTSTEPPSSPEGATAAPGQRGATAVAVLVSVSALVFGAVVLTLLLLPHGSETAGPSASPSASATGPLCRGAACEGKDPLLMRCGPSPETLAEHVTATGASVQLRYSSMCGATWVRMWGTRIGDEVEVRGHLARVRTRTDADTYVHTLMATTRTGAVVQACFVPATGGRKECFQARVDPAASEPAPGTHASSGMPASGTRAQGGTVGRRGRPVGR
ncbi:helix-turn-helix domain-containing protein [Streptomyces sp. NPDC051677]|uniref:helix-turn-helix domain-containing protein n=1 Tax=Streptomyces sp. NPDC051677 TaxID=3365669 RepID=UPI0037CF7ACA